MLCRLCIEESKDFHELYDANYQENDIYQICSIYFKEELEKLDKSLIKSYKSICETCWIIISNYDDLRKRVHQAQIKLASLKISHSNVKLEEVDVGGSDFNDEFSEKEELDEHPLDALVAAVINDNVVDLKLEHDFKFNDSENCPSDDNLSVNEFIQEQDNDIDSDVYFDKPEDIILDDEEEDEKPLSEIFKKKIISKESQVLVNPAPRSKGRPRKLTPNSCNSNSFEKNRQINKSAEHDKFIADWKDTLPCDLCDYYSANFSELRKHFHAFHERVKPYVKCCGKKYIKRIRLVEHIRKHIDPESFKCTICGKCSANSDCLSKHMKTVHGPQRQEKKFVCEICFKGFSQQSVLKRHMEVHATGQKDHLCPQCGKGFVLEKRLQIHIKNIHCSTCVCEQCGKSFRNPYALKDHHLQEHQGIQKPKWPCDQCPAQLKSKYNLSYHKRTVHHDGSTLYECGECGKVALNEGALLKHKRNVHEAPRKFKCTICDKAFKVAQVLREHMTIHTGEELYKCPHCPKTFRVSANMHHHRKRVHPKEWAEKRNERHFIANTDMSQVSQKVIL